MMPLEIGKLSRKVWKAIYAQKAGGYDSKEQPTPPGLGAFVRQEIGARPYDYTPLHEGNIM